MEIINPNEIGSKISTLIVESKVKFIAVTPYIDVSNWKKILINIENAIERKVSIDFYYREIKDVDFNVLNKLGIKLFKIKGLHTKMYFNENEMIISSMNLYEFSDLHSIEIAIFYSNLENYNKLFDYFHKYIYKQINERTLIPSGFKYELDDLHDYLSNRFVDSRIIRAKTYLFSKNLIPFFHVFINEYSIGLKLPTGYPDDNIIKKHSIIFTNLSNHSFNIYKPNENYQYCRWEIELKGKTDFEKLNLLVELRELITSKLSV